MQVTFNAGKEYPSITGPSADEFAAELLRLEESDFETVVINLKGAETISSMAMGSIFAMYQKLTEQGRRVILVNANEHVKRMLQMVNMAHLLDFEDDDEE